MTEPVNRVTSTYTLEVQTTEPMAVVSDLVAATPVQLSGSGVDSEKAFIRFRAEDDTAARAIADQIQSDGAYRLTTGYGVNQREV